MKKIFEEQPKKVQVERWENVLRVLRALTPHQRKKHWNMGFFGQETECGTIACAAGHCGMDPWFRRRGIKLVTLGMSQRITGDMVPNSNFRQNPYQLITFFGGAGYINIFGDGSPRSVGQVIREVRAHIKNLKAAE